MLRNNPLSLFDELLQPYKYGPRMYDNDVGTEEDPSIIVRSEMVQKKYKAVVTHRIARVDCFVTSYAS